jgi:hypothetical protein
MNQIFLTAILTLIAKLDLLQLMVAVYARVKRELPDPVLERIDSLVRRVDALDIPGEDKFKEVVAALMAPESPVRGMLSDIPRQLVLWAIQSAYDRMRRNQGA